MLLIVVILVLVFGLRLCYRLQHHLCWPFRPLGFFILKGGPHARHTAPLVISVIRIAPLIPFLELVAWALLVSKQIARPDTHSLMDLLERRHFVNHSQALSRNARGTVRDLSLKNH